MARLGIEVRLEELFDLGLATVQARRNGRSAIEAWFGAPLPDGPARRRSGALALTGTAPEAWLCAWTGPEPAWPEGASVTDQSDAWRVFRLTGPGARDALAHSVYLDLSARAFAPDAYAAPTVAHMRILLWAAPDGDGFEIAVPRSSTDSFLSLANLAGAL